MGQQVDKEFCLKVLERGLRPNFDYRPADFRGPAKNWSKFDESDFQEFAQEHGINAETTILIWDDGSDKYGVQIAHA